MAIDSKVINEDLYGELVSKYGQERVDREIALEEESRDMAFEAYMANLARRSEDGSRADVGTASTLVKEALGVYTNKIQNYCDLCLQAKAGRHPALVPFIEILGAEKVAFIAIRSIINSCLIHVSAVSPLATQIGKDLEEEIRINRMIGLMDKSEKAVFDKGLSKRVGLSYKKAFIQAREKYFVEEDRIEKWKPLPKQTLCIVGFKLIELFCNSTGLCELYTVQEGVKMTYHIKMDNDIVEYIFKNDKEIASTLFKNRPMVIPPKSWTTPFDGGYYINLKKPLRLVRIPYKKCKQLYSNLEMPNVYKAVNAIQATPWRINKRVLEVAEEITNRTYIPEALDMPTAEPAEPPIRPEEADTNEEIQKEWRKAMVSYYQRDNIRRSKRLLLNAQINLAKTYVDDPAIYFPHNLDFRGRVYPVTSLSPQSNDFGKSLLEFADGVALGEHGATWLALQGANCYGLDKAEFEERIEWVYGNPEFIMGIAENPLENLAWTETDSPWEFLAFCFEWDDYIKSGMSPDFKSHLAVAFDGSCSGIQHFSAMLRDEVGGTAVNLIPDDHVHDIYKMVSDKVEDVVKEDAINGTPDEMKTDKDGNEYLAKGTKSLAKEWLAHGINRKVTKRSVMTLPYGSRQYGFAEQVLEDTIYPYLEKHNTGFERPHQSARYMAKLIWDAVKKVVVKAVEAMEWLQKASGLLAKEKTEDGNGIPTYWVTPAGFLVHQDYKKPKLIQIDTVVNGSIKIRDIGSGETSEKEGRMRIAVYEDTDKLDSRKQKQGIAPNFVHSMDASHLMLTVDACYDQGVPSFAMIHDSYGTHAGYGDVMFKTVREVIIQTYTDNDVLQDLHDHVENLIEDSSDLPEVPSKGNLDINCIRDSMYAFA